ncbi:MAG TPA: hypothetical protein VGB89_14035 [Bacteroidota bacterium]
MNKLYNFVLMITLIVIFSSHSSSQVFVRITDPTNPIFTDGGSPALLISPAECISTSSARTTPSIQNGWFFSGSMSVPSRGGM